VHLQASLVSPAALTAPKMRDPLSQRLRLVSERRDQDGHRLDDLAVGGSHELATGAPILTGLISARLADLQDPVALVGLARRLSITLLEHFGIVTATVLRPPGDTDPLIDPLRAPEGWQQLVYQHARALELPVDDLSPTGRRARYDELLAQARAALQR